MLPQALQHLTYFAVIAMLMSLGSVTTLGDPTTTGALIVVGVLGAWRYSWAMTNFARAFVFRSFVYPKRRRARQRLYDARPVGAHAYVLITTYGVAPEHTVPVYKALFEACSHARAPQGATIVASVVDGADARLIQMIFDTCKTAWGLSGVVLIIDRIKASGKRDAMARTLEILAKHQPTARDICIFADGDTCVPVDIVARSAPVFTDPKVGALTTDEGVLMEDETLFRDWFVMRFNQRQVMMCSMGLGNRVLTLTGRMSVFRADLATDPGFINGVRNDWIDHWRLGRVQFLTGDDKSTWYWLLKNGFETAYLPDVRSWSFETQPEKTFIKSAQVLMVRWFGNMMRTNGRALKLPAEEIGYFTWWSILDQRVSMWTTLVGPMTVAMAALAGAPGVLPLYAGWVMLTRYLFCVIMSAFRGTWFPVTHPPILYFSQVFGAAYKTFVSFRLDRQKWTRQKTGGGGAGMTLPERIKRLESTTHHWLAMIWLTIAILFVTKV